MAIAGGQKAGRRRGAKRPRPPATPSEVGLALRETREANGVGLAEVHDRTGVAYAHLEALENGDLGRFSDRHTALVCLGRYADLFGLDINALAAVVEEHWPEAVLAGALHGSAATSTGSAPSTGPVAAGHLSRHPGDSGHLLAFTQTDQVPGVRAAAVSAGGNHTHYAESGSFVYDPRPPVRPAPLVLRVAVWFTALLVVVGLVGLAAHQWDPQLLTDAHLTRPAQTAGVTPPVTGGGRHTNAPASPAAVAEVTETSTAPNTRSVAVKASQYAVLITPTAPVWIQVTTPGTTAPVFAGVVPGGQAKTFNSATGALSVELGASKVTLQVQVAGKTVPGWSFTPPTVPFTLTFSSTTTS